MAVRWVVMSGDYYGSFTTAGSKEQELVVRSVSWLAGPNGLRVATKFDDAARAQLACTQVFGVDALLPPRAEAVELAD